ncbi:MAG: hypothetical protein GF329_19405 [Candidatus Lokiarchaeota archaeon]|nr:hypothetical protein [Candidatus Lokiarchaeota archaeon]
MSQNKIKILLKSMEITAKYLKVLIRINEDSNREWISTKFFSEKFDVHPSTVTEHFQKLADLDLVIYKRYRGIKLTKSGKRHGLLLMRKHRILEYFFVNYLNFSEEEACLEADKIDLLISEIVIDKICEKFSHPKLCPCQKEIYHD